MPGSRPRTKRREQERVLRKGVRRLTTLATQLPGGSAEQPIDVSSASVVELKARATACLQCDGEFEIRSDHATTDARGVLRELGLSCRGCHAPRTLWFRVLRAGAN